MESCLTHCLVKFRPYLAINAPIGSRTRNPVPQRIACVLERLSTGLSGIDMVSVKGGTERTRCCLRLYATVAVFFLVFDGNRQVIAAKGRSAT